jgi:predicted RNA-binding protein with RPS1 domain
VRVLAGGGGPQSDLPPELGMVLPGTVKRIEPYGVFVAMDGYRKFGLVHSSQVCNYLSFTKDDSDEMKKAELVSKGAQVLGRWQQ